MDAFEDAISDEESEDNILAENFVLLANEGDPGISCSEELISMQRQIFMDVTPIRSELDDRISQIKDQLAIVRAEIALEAANQKNKLDIIVDNTNIPTQNNILSKEEMENKNENIDELDELLVEALEEYKEGEIPDVVINNPMPQSDFNTMIDDFLIESNPHLKNLDPNNKEELKTEELINMEINKQQEKDLKVNKGSDYIYIYYI